MFVIKFLFYFSLSFVILSVPVSGNKKVFNYCDELAKPYTAQIFGAIKGAISNGVHESKRVSKKLFNNTSEKIDEVKSSISASQKEAIKEIDSTPKDSYTPEEREALLRILQQTHH
jgi:gas vesicle protein